MESTMGHVEKDTERSSRTKTSNLAEPKQSSKMSNRAFCSKVHLLDDTLSDIDFGSNDAAVETQTRMSALVSGITQAASAQRFETSHRGFYSRIHPLDDALSDVDFDDKDNTDKSTTKSAACKYDSSDRAHGRKLRDCHSGPSTQRANNPCPRADEDDDDDDDVDWDARSTLAYEAAFALLKEPRCNRQGGGSASSPTPGQALEDDGGHAAEPMMEIVFCALCLVMTTVIWGCCWA